MGAFSDSILISAGLITVTGKHITTTLTKADIADALYQEIGLSKTESNDLIDGILGHISDALIQGRDVKIANFGKFKLAQKKERLGRNPRTGEPAIIAGRKIVTFKPSPYLIRRVDSARKNER
ncbi:integration host factor subunit alpha [Hellea sp.]|nr:integration host factor subunit alpha [Hellea sp.]